MSSSRPPELIPSKLWPGIIDRLLDGTRTEQTEARETLWVEVTHYVVQFALLPIGPLSDDPDVRSDIALRLLERLEQHDLRHLRHWREVQRSRLGDSAWWAWIRTMARNLATDAARGSRQNLARRGEPYRWARIVSVDPAVLEAFDEAEGEALGQALDFLEHATVESIESYLEALQDMVRSGPEHGNGDGDGELLAELPPRPAKRGENGDGGGAR